MTHSEGNEPAASLYKVGHTWSVATGSFEEKRWDVEVEQQREGGFTSLFIETEYCSCGREYHEKGKEKV